MSLAEAVTKVLNQLEDLVNHIHPSDYTRPSDELGGSTVGQHIRHTLEFFMCFQAGFSEGIVNYDRRAHDKIIETDKDVALNTIRDCNAFMSTVSENRGLRLEVAYGTEEGQSTLVDTNAMRELIYNIEHAVHHMAIIRIGIRQIAPYVHLNKDFGLAASTMRFKDAKAAISSSH